MKKRIEKLIEELKLEEKAALCSGASFWQTEAVKRLDVPSMLVADGPHGVRYVADRYHTDEAKPATCFPTASAIAASWNRDIAAQIGQALAKECKSLGVDILLGPGINIKRTPLGGRNFEYYSEDPYLTGEIATSFVKAVQEAGIGTSLKHYTANNQEYERFCINAQVEERALREIYLPAFEQVVKEAKPWTVMCAYNQVNGDFASENKYLLTDILREEWGFKGVVVSDWWAVHDRIAGIKAGLDLEMPGPAPINDEKIVKAVKKGELEEEVLDRAVRRNLEVLFRAVENRIDNAKLPIKKHHQLAREAAAECMVLLKNEADILPLDFNQLDSVAVIGELAQKPRYQGVGSSRVNPTQLDIPYEELQKLAGEEINLTYAPGYSNSEEVSEDELLKAVTAAKEAEAAVIFAGLPKDSEAEGYDRENLKLPEQQNKLIKQVAEVQPNTVVVLSNGAVVDMRLWIEEVPAVLEAWLSGQAGGGAVADVLTGKINPSGKLSETFPVKLADNPSYLNYPGRAAEVKYKEGIYVGYRYYDKKEIEPLFPFGHGLSYTEFKYSNLTCKTEISDEEELTVTLEVTNTGKYLGKEVVQLYIAQEEPRLDRPPKELRRFKKIKLEPGESKEVVFKLNYRDFAYYIPQEEEWVVDTDNFKLLVGSSSRDIRLEREIKVIGSYTPHLLTKKSSVDNWLAEEAGRKAISRVLSSKHIKRLEAAEGYIKERPLYRITHYLTKNRVTEAEIEKICQVYQELT